MRQALCAPSTSGRVHINAFRPSHQPRRSCAPCRLRAIKPEDKPEWVRELEEHAEVDEAVAELLRGTGGDPKIIQARMKAEMDALHERIMSQSGAGSQAPMRVRFRRPVSQYDMWVWLELTQPPAGDDLELLQEVIDSWFALGRLGGYNASNLQVHYSEGMELAEIEYDAADAEGGLAATMHDSTPLEMRGCWARFWVDMGTADELALDVLINALACFSREQLGIKQLLFGGENKDWRLPDADPRLERLPEVTMDPMRGPVEYGSDDDE